MIHKNIYNQHKDILIMKSRKKVTKSDYNYTVLAS